MYWFLATAPLTVPSLLNGVLGTALVVLGQILNVGAYTAIGKVGIYYGFKLGHTVPWCTSFPFNFVPHPQYMGACTTVWGIFLLAASPAHWDAGLFWVGLIWNAFYVVSGAIEQYL